MSLNIFAGVISSDNIGSKVMTKLFYETVKTDLEQCGCKFMQETIIGEGYHHSMSIDNSNCKIHRNN
jgi:hypothetical protein